MPPAPLLPILDHGDPEALRDPALVVHDGVCHCFYTVARPAGASFSLCIGASSSRDLARWTPRPALGPDVRNWSSPGSIVRQGDDWVMSLQSYPIDAGATWGNESARLWTSRSRDLVAWDEPRPLAPAGARVAWTPSPRQIDPFIIAHDGRWWCLYKAAGQFGLLVSDDLSAWREASPQRPVFGSGDTSDGCTVENPCVVACDRGFALLYSPCRPGRGIGIAYSEDLLTWRDAHDLELPPLPWAPGGPTAAMAIDRRADAGTWLMALHGERHSPANGHGAAIALLRSADLERWR